MAEDRIAALERLSLIGIVDVGSNSVRLVMFEAQKRSPDYFFNEKTICGLGRGLAETGRLDAEGRRRALAALRRFTHLAREMGATRLIGIGTAALRDAEDGPEFRDEIEAETGLALRVATGEEEARLAAEGVMLGWPNATAVIADLGGSSLEIASVEDGVVGRRVSTEVGHLSLDEADPEEARRILKALDAAAAPFAGDVRNLTLVGGAWRALAKAHMTVSGYPLTVLQGYPMTPSEAAEHCDWALEATPETLKKRSGASSSRAASIRAGAMALKGLLRSIRPARVHVSAYGVREGVLYEQMSPELRAADPLIEAAAAMESRSARFPGFGEELYRWLHPLIEGWPEARLRLARAACLLNDVNWRKHPDFRADACFATVAQANLSGLDHSGRIFLGAALLHRYKGGASETEAAAVAMLDAEERRAAAFLGRACRLGAMLSGSVDGLLGLTRLERRGDDLVLVFTGLAADLAGERVARRLTATAEAVGLSGRMEIEAAK